MRQLPPHFRFTLENPVRRDSACGSNVANRGGGITRHTALPRWFQRRLWRLKWLESIVLMWSAIAMIGCSRPQSADGAVLLAMMLVSPLTALIFLAMLKAFVFLIIISSAPISSIIVRQCV